MAQSVYKERPIIFYKRNYTQKMVKKAQKHIDYSLAVHLLTRVLFFYRNKYLLSPNVLKLFRSIFPTSFSQVTAAFLVDYKPSLFNLYMSLPSPVVFVLCWLRFRALKNKSAVHSILLLHKIDEMLRGDRSGEYVLCCVPLTSVALLRIVLALYKTKLRACILLPVMVQHCKTKPCLELWAVSPLSQW